MHFSTVNHPLSLLSAPRESVPLPSPRSRWRAYRFIPLQPLLCDLSRRQRIPLSFFRGERILDSSIRIAKCQLRHPRVGGVVFLSFCQRWSFIPFTSLPVSRSRNSFSRTIPTPSIENTTRKKRSDGFRKNRLSSNLGSFPFVRFQKQFDTLLLYSCFPAPRAILQP